MGKNKKGMCQNETSLCYQVSTVTISLGQENKEHSSEKFPVRYFLEMGEKNNFFFGSGSRQWYSILTAAGGHFPKSGHHLLEADAMHTGSRPSDRPETSLWTHAPYWCPTCSPACWRPRGCLGLGAGARSGGACGRCCSLLKYFSRRGSRCSSHHLGGRWGSRRWGWCPRG